MLYKQKTAIGSFVYSNESAKYFIKKKIQDKKTHLCSILSPFFTSLQLFLLVHANRFKLNEHIEEKYEKLRNKSRKKTHHV